MIAPNCQRMDYADIQKLMPLFDASQVDYHLAMATAAAKKQSDGRVESIWSLVSEDGKKAVHEAMRR